MNCVGKRGRIQVIQGLFLSFVAGLVFFAASPALAEGEWYEQILGHGSPFEAKERKRRRAAKKEIKLEDLRVNDVPWRSDIMIDATLAAIDRYRKIVQRGGWPQVQGPRMMRPGDDDERVPALRKRLRASGDLTGKGGGYFSRSFDFDGRLEAAVKSFQKRHGLRVRGRVDRPTFAALNVSAEQRLRQLELNLSRLRELSTGRIEDRYILVNVPAFQLEAVDRFEVQRRHRVIVGRVGRDTPTLKATIKALNFFPYWRVPESVAKLDLIPRLQKEPDYLEKEHIRALRDHYNGEEIQVASIDWTQVSAKELRFRQDPGPWNALGLVRIDMPNEHTVYMHDTPLKRLFKSTSRAYSAGCVRVQDVMQLVEWIASREVGWEQAGRTEFVVADGEPLTVDLTQPVPVYFTYITAWGEPGGTVQFRPDIYNRDGAREFAGEADPDELPPPREGLAP